ncbi:hypothetical protein ACJBU6_04645 [Exserohilum turcicum]
MATTSNTPLWHVAYPAPKTSPASICREEVLDMMKRSTETTSKDYILVDLRCNDCQGGTIQHSINLPAESLYPTLPIAYKLFKDSGLCKIIWYCSSSKGRGTRAAGWFADYIADQNDDHMKSLVLLEGVKGWATAGDEYIKCMVEYNAQVWL